MTHNVKNCIDLESTCHELSYEVQYDMGWFSTVNFKIIPWGKQFLTHSESQEGQSQSAPKK
jgi:hypothetical protein